MQTCSTKTDKIHYLKSGLNCHSLRASPTGANWAENPLSSTCCCDHFILRLSSQSCLPMKHRLTLIHSIKDTWYNTARSRRLCPDPPRLFPPCRSVVPPGGSAPGTQGPWRCWKAGERRWQDFLRGWAQASTSSEARQGKWPWDSSQGEINACLWQPFFKTAAPQAWAGRKESRPFPGTLLRVWWALRYSRSSGLGLPYK